MTPPIYDDKDIFEAYARLPRSLGGLGAMPEWPALQAMLPDLHNRRVLDLGCGFGWFCRWAREQGAARVLGVDISDRMLERAHDTTNDSSIDYIKADLETLNLPQSTFDLAYSALALHYVVDLERLFGEVHRALNPGGAFVFCVEHPISTAPTSAGLSIDTYQTQGPRASDLRFGDLQSGGPVKQHRTFGAYLKLLLGAGFSLSAVEEWRPSETPGETEPIPTDTAPTDAGPTEAHERPIFLLISAKR